MLHKKAARAAAFKAAENRFFCTPLPGCAALWPPRAQHPRPARRPSSPGPPAGGHIPAEWAAGRPPPSGPPPA